MDSAKNIGSQLMKKSDIRVAVADLMQEEGLTKRYRVQKLKQNVEAVDPNVSLKALDQSWKLDGSYAAEKHVNLNMTYNDITQEMETIDADIAALEAELGMGGGDHLDDEIMEQQDE